MTYAIVSDIPASWAVYEDIAAEVGDRAPDGLIVHVAGRTDEGFRIIDVWETEEAFLRFEQERLGPVVNRHTAGLRGRRTVRDLRCESVIRARPEEGDA